MIIGIGSKNPVKVEAVKRAFEKYFNDIEVVSYEADSLVRSQPQNDETYIGAKNRAVGALKHVDDAEFGIGIESGINKYFDRWFGNTVVCIVNKNQEIHFGLSTGYEIWDELKDKMLSGIEMGDLLSELTGIQNIKQKGGAIGFLTDGELNRTEETARACIMALIPFLKNNLYK